MASSSSVASRHPIGVVSRRTGLKRELIRAWERRYAAVEPERTDTNRRLYSDLDVERLALLREVTGLGHNIGQVADLPNRELEELLAQEHQPLTSVATGRPAGQADPAEPGPSAAGDANDPVARDTVARDTVARDPVAGDPREVARGLVTAALDAVRRLDGRKLEAIFERGSLALSGLGVVGHVISPLMHEVGKLWADGVLRPVHEHLATAVARAYVSTLLRNFRPTENAPSMVATTPSGQHHELGALVAAVAAAAQGWQVTYLGPDLPAEEIAAAAHARDARVVALSLLYPADDPKLPEELRRLARLLPDDTALVVGGAGSDAYDGVLAELDARRAEELPQLHELFAELRSGGTVHH